MNDRKDLTSLAPRITARLPRRRSVLKCIYWLMLPLLIWFLFMTPQVVPRLGGNRLFTIHSNVALFFVTLSLLWTADYLRRGLASRPAPVAAASLALRWVDAPVAQGNTLAKCRARYAA